LSTGKISHAILLFPEHLRPVSSKWFIDNICDQDITHTEKDNPGIVDCNKIVEISMALNTLIRSL
jgi:hypothetical protein